MEDRREKDECPICEKHKNQPEIKKIVLTSTKLTCVFFVGEVTRFVVEDQFYQIEPSVIASPDEPLLGLRTTNPTSAVDL